MNKKMLVSKMKQTKEHVRVIPELLKVGLKEEAKKQIKDLKEIIKKR